MSRTKIKDSKRPVLDEVTSKQAYDTSNFVKVYLRSFLFGIYRYSDMSRAPDKREY